MQWRHCWWTSVNQPLLHMWKCYDNWHRFKKSSFEATCLVFTFISYFRAQEAKASNDLEDWIKTPFLRDLCNVHPTFETPLASPTCNDFSSLHLLFLLLGVKKQHSTTLNSSNFKLWSPNSHIWFYLSSKDDDGFSCILPICELFDWRPVIKASFFFFPTALAHLPNLWKPSTCMLTYEK